MVHLQNSSVMHNYMGYLIIEDTGSCASNRETSDLSYSSSLLTYIIVDALGPTAGIYDVNKWLHPIIFLLFSPQKHAPVWHLVVVIVLLFPANNTAMKRNNTIHKILLEAIREAKWLIGLLALIMVYKVKQVHVTA